ncbi:MAG: hypothetical protein KGL55_07925, partial [Rhodospirillales bacterium]|nr:hypothetical protein [Rhodospirillales bacterium]
HAAPHDPLGARFLAEALRACAPDPAALARPPTAATLAPAIRATRAWYAALRPALWRQGRAFPRDLAEQRAMMRAGEIDLALAANPSEAVAGAANGLLPAGARAVALAGGAIGGLGVNVVPAGAARPEAALLLADFLLSPSAQAHAMDGRILGSPTVLAPRFLSAFSGPHAPAGPASLGEGVAVAGPHPGWTAHLAMICGSCSSTIAARGIVTQP